MPHQLTRRALCATLAAAATLPSAALAAKKSRYSLNQTGHALKGYDTTAYFTSGTAAEGKRATSVTWKGAKWNFATPEDAALFQANPDRYAPQFGGYCTRAMSLRKRVPADPEIWRIHNDKLYVFFARRGGKAFDQGPDEMIALAQAYWDTLA